MVAALGNRTSEPELRNWYWVVCPVFCITFAIFFAWVVRTCLQGNRPAKLAERAREDAIELQPHRRAPTRQFCQAVVNTRESDGDIVRRGRGKEEGWSSRTRAAARRDTRKSTPGRKNSAN